MNSKDTDTSIAMRPSVPLTHLLHLLQGAKEPSIADVGLTRLDGERLDALYRLARQQAEACMEYADVLLSLLRDRIEEHDPRESGSFFSQPVQQLQRLLAEVKRWQDLADNAAYYRAHPAVHHRIARALE